jgi:hypothetical protein
VLHLLRLSTLPSQVVNFLSRIVTIIIVTIVDIVSILLTNVGVRPNLMHLLQLLSLLRVLLLQLLPLVSLRDLLSLYLQLTLRQLSTKFCLVLVIHLPLSSTFCQVNLSLGFLIVCWNRMTPYASSFTTSALPPHTSLIHIVNGSLLNLSLNRY